MRHGVKLNRLSRTSSHRKALMKNLACQLIQHKRIFTTLAKAKALRVYVEPLLTKSKSDSTTNRRVVFAKLQDKEAIKELFSTVSEKIAARNGGYTRIIKLAPRVGDAAEMAMIELVDFNDLYTGKPAAAADKKKTRRSRGGAKKEAAKASATEATTTAAEELSASADTAAATTEATTASAEATESTSDVASATAEATSTETSASDSAETSSAAASSEAAPAAEATTESSSAAVSTDAKGDELEIIEGIGPKIADILRSKGITTFAALAATSTEDIKAILVEAGPIYAGKDPSTWAQQSQMAADGKMDELKAWQDELKGGTEA